MVESCSGIDRPLGDVEWYAAPDYLRNPDDNSEFIQGYWSLASNRIVLVSNDTVDGGTVRHEMLHALLRVGKHPRSAFLQNCGGVVDCQEGCVRDGGPVPPPDPAAPTVAPSMLEVTSAVSPSTPSSSIDGGLFTFTVTVRNPFPHPVVARLPERPFGGRAVSYPLDVRATNGSGLFSGDLEFDPGVTYFAGEETKRKVFDFDVVPIGFTSYFGFPGLGAAIAVPPATYRFRGGYGDHMAPDLNVVVNP
jgi:hypothetical protein